MVAHAATEAAVARWTVIFFLLFVVLSRKLEPPAWTWTLQRQVCHTLAISWGPGEKDLLIACT